LKCIYIHPGYADGFAILFAGIGICLDSYQYTFCFLSHIPLYVTYDETITIYLLYFLGYNLPVTLRGFSFKT